MRSHTNGSAYSCVVTICLAAVVGVAAGAALRADHGRSPSDAAAAPRDAGAARSSGASPSFGPPRTLSSNFSVTSGPQGASFDSATGGVLVLAVGQVRAARARACRRRRRLLASSGVAVQAMSLVHVDTGSGALEAVVGNVSYGAVSPVLAAAAADAAFVTLDGAVAKLTAAGPVTIVPQLWTTVAAGVNGSVFGVAGGTPAQVLRATSAGAVTTVVNASAGLTQAHSLAVGSDGTLLVLDVVQANASRVVSVSAEGDVIPLVQGLPQPPFGNALATDGKGALFMLDAAGGVWSAPDSVADHSMAATAVSVATVAAWSSGVTCDAQGNLYVAEPQRIVVADRLA